MKYSTVEIRPHIEGNFKWRIASCDIPYERSNEAAKPCPVGFYHYKRKLGLENAFEELKACMIESHEKEIDRLIKSRDSLVMLQLPKAKNETQNQKTTP